MEGMEATILAAEERARLLQERIADPAIMADRNKMHDACEQLANAQHEVDRLYARWAELEARSI